MAEETENQARTASEQARELLRENRPAEAVQVLRRHLSTQPGTAADLVLLGIALAQSGEGLAAIQPLEQAVAMEPENAVAHYNLGQVYRQGGRQREALGAFERALQLRPGYAAAAQAAEELRRAGRPPASGDAGSPEAASVPSANVPGSTRAPSPGAPADGGTAAAEESGSARRRLYRAAWQLIVSPGEAVNSGLDFFFNTRGAIMAVVEWFGLSLAVQVLIVWLSNPSGISATELMQVMPLLIVVSVVQVAATAGTIAGYNRITGGADDFIADFGSLALSFAMIAATIAMVTAPLTLVFGLAGVSGGFAIVSLVAGLWTLVLEVMLVSAATDISGFAAFALLFGANFVARIATSFVAAVLGLTPD